MTQIGDAIRAERKARGLTLEALADRLGISVVYLSELERYKVPNVDRVLDIASELTEVDTAAWLWLLLEDKWGASVADMMRQHAAREAGR